MTIEQIKAIIEENSAKGYENRYDGLTSAEIGAYNRNQMFGDCTVENWNDFEWSLIVN